MCDADNNLKSTLDQINNLMVSLRTLKNSAALRNLTDLRPMLCSATRWSGTCNVLKRFLDLRQLLDMGLDEESDFEFPQEMRTIPFMKRVQNYMVMLTLIEEATKALQKRGILLAEAQGYLDILSQKICKGRVEQKSWARSCLLQQQYIGMESKKLVK
jgi:hypothetical protein